MKSYCSTHYINYETGRSCPECRKDEMERSNQEIIDSLSALADSRAESAEEIKQAIEDSAYKYTNPGDYECPHCGLVSLKYCKSRCPMCHADIEGSYWDAVIKRAKEAAEREALRKKEEAAKVREQEEQDRAEERRRENARRKANGDLFCIFGVLLFLASAVMLLITIVRVVLEIVGFLFLAFCQSWTDLFHFLFYM